MEIMVIREGISPGCASCVIYVEYSLILQSTNQNISFKVDLPSFDLALWSVRGKALMSEGWTKINNEIIENQGLYRNKDDS